MNQGYVKVHRCMLESIVMSDPMACYLWMRLLLEVNWRPGWHRGEPLRVGELAFSRRNLATKWSVAPQTLRRWFTIFQQHEMLTIRKSRDQWSILTLVNYAKYQHKSEGDEPVVKLRVVKPQPSAPDQQQKREENEAAWAQAAEELRGEGVQHARPVLNEARERGVSTVEIFALVDHYRKFRGRLGPGALHHRIRNAFPGDRAQDGWPVASSTDTVAWKERRRCESRGQQLETIIAKAGRRKNASEEEIREKIREAFAREKIPSRFSSWLTDWEEQTIEI